MCTKHVTWYIQLKMVENTLYNFTFANLYHFIVTIFIISTDVSKFNSLHLVKMVDVFQNLLLSNIQNNF